jgi:hypothetical protein
MVQGGKENGFSPMMIAESIIDTHIVKRSNDRGNIE